MHPVLNDEKVLQTLRDSNNYVLLAMILTRMVIQKVVRDVTISLNLGGIRLGFVTLMNAACDST